MFSLDQIKVLHIEPTTVCQAACPQCDREDPQKYIHHKNVSELTLDKIKQVIPINVVQNLDKVFMCGVFGDPAACKEAIEIFQWFRDNNPTITLGMNTNGGLRNPSWWNSLGQLMNGSADYIVFSIDGLQDTNHMYRRHVLWDKVMENSDAFINAGGSAHWDMLVFDHNKHQINDAELLARTKKFKWFRCKISKRFKYKQVEGLNPPEDINLPNVEMPKKINCHALREKSMYLSATGEVMPCCWIGSRVFNRDILIDSALSTPRFQGVVDSWNTANPLPICLQTCGVETSSSNTEFQQQWFKEIQF